MTENATTYNRQTVKAVLLNRLIIIAGWIGIFIAGFLTYTHFKGVLPPCGENSGGCQTVQTSQFAMFYGVPVSLIGLVGYVIITGLATMRSTAADVKVWKKLVMAGLIMSGFGAGMSMVFMYISFGMLHAKCNWCVASAVTMVVLFLLHGFLANASDEAHEERKPKLDLMATGIGVVLALGLFGFSSQGLEEIGGMKINFSNVENSAIIPRADKILGNPEAPVMVVEFADINCPVCRIKYAEMKKVVTDAGPNAAFAYRSLPLYMLEGHETSIQAAVIAEYAADQGKYFDFLNEAMKEGNTEACKDVEGLIRIAGDVGLDKDAVRKMISEQDEEMFNKAAEDFADAQKMGISQTPTFIILAAGVPPKAVGHGQLAATLNAEPYKSLLK